MSGMHCKALMRCTYLIGIMHEPLIERLLSMNDIQVDTLQNISGMVRIYHRYVLWVILGGLFALDIFTTTISLHLGNFERNPIMVPFVNNPVLHGFIKIIAYLFLFVAIEGAVLFIEEKRPESKPFWIKLNFQTLYWMIIFIMIFLIGAYLYVVINNIWTLS
jgi:hypothetical protein